MSRKRRHEESGASCSGGAEAQIKNDYSKEEFLEDSPKKSSKRIKREILEEFDFLRDNEDQTTTTTTCNGHSNMNGVANFAGTANQELDDGQPEEFYVWLVQKPKNVPLEQLSELVFPRKPKSTKIQCIQVNEKSRKRRSSIPNGPNGHPMEQQQCTSAGPVEYECRFEKPTKQMFHVHTKDAKTAKELRNLRPSSKIRGIAMINRKLNIADGFPIPPEEDFLAGP